jgi:hypothetical protein
LQVSVRHLSRAKAFANDAPKVSRSALLHYTTKDQSARPIYCVMTQANKSALLPAIQIRSMLWCRPVRRNTRRKWNKYRGVGD